MSDIALRIRILIDSAMASLREERGQDLLEYALIGGLVSVALVIGFALFSGDITTMTTAIADCIDFDVTAGVSCAD